MISLFDASIFNFINHGLNNSFFNFIMPIITYLGSGEFVLVIGVILLFSKKKEVKVLGILLIAGMTISYYAVNALKLIVARPRPFLVLPNVMVLGHAGHDPSFPSGHATTVFMAAALLSSRFKKYAVFYLAAALVCFSRVYVGVHFPTDVLGGAIVGTLIGLVLIYTTKYLFASK